MGSVLAVTVSGLVGDVGTVAGIAAALASAVLAGVVLAQGREMRRLRDELRDEAERALAVEASLTAELATAHRQAAVAAPVQQQPRPVAAAEDVVPQPVTADGTELESDARPALGSATRSPAIAAVASPPLIAAPAAAAVTSPVGAAEPRPGPVVIPSPAPAATVAAARADAGPQPLGEPSTVAAGGIARSPRPPAQSNEPAGRRRGPLPFVLGGLVVIGIVVFAVSSLGGGGGDGGTVKVKPTPASNPSAGSIVAVLNGTPVSGLAGQVSRELVRVGFKAGRVATARDQQQTRTVVSYMPGHLDDAEAVAQTLKLGSAPVPADDAVQAIACPDPATCNVEVIVTVGSDRAR